MNSEKVLILLQLFLSGAEYFFSRLSFLKLQNLWGQARSSSYAVYLKRYVVIPVIGEGKSRGYTGDAYIRFKIS
ncbi:hypothetical protein GCM10027284_35770 [Cyclobacterium sediminis]